MIACLPDILIVKTGTETKNDRKKTEKQNVFNSFLYTDDDPGLVHVWTIFFLPFFFSFSFSGHTNNHRVYIPPPDSFIIILIINKKEKKNK